MAGPQRVNGHRPNGLLNILDPSLKLAPHPTQEDVDFDLVDGLSSIVRLSSEVPGNAFSARSLGTERQGNAILLMMRGSSSPSDIWSSMQTKSHFMQKGGTTCPLNSSAIITSQGLPSFTHSRPLTCQRHQLVQQRALRRANLWSSRPTVEMIMPLAQRWSRAENLPARGSIYWTTPSLRPPFIQIGAVPLFYAPTDRCAGSALFGLTMPRRVRTIARATCLSR